MSSSLQPVSMLMSNLNVESAARYSPNAVSAAQDTGQRQEILQEGIRMVQTVQASQAAAEAQRVHRKDAGDEQEGRGRRERDSFEHTDSEEKETVSVESAPVIRENVRNRKKFEFLA